MEYLVTMTTRVPPGTSEQAVADVRAREVAGQGHLVRLWTLPGEGRALGVYRARDGAEMAAIVKSLPLDPFMNTEITPLSPHPTDPASAVG